MLEEDGSMQVDGGQTSHEKQTQEEEVRQRGIITAQLKQQEELEKRQELGFTCAMASNDRDYILAVLRRHLGEDMDEEYWGYCLDEILVLDKDSNIVRIDPSILISDTYVSVFDGDSPKTLCILIAEDTSAYERIAKVKEAMAVFGDAIQAYELLTKDRIETGASYLIHDVFSSTDDPFVYYFYTNYMYERTLSRDIPTEIREEIITSFKFHKDYEPSKQFRLYNDREYLWVKEVSDDVIDRMYDEIVARLLPKDPASLKPGLW